MKDNKLQPLSVRRDYGATDAASMGQVAYIDRAGGLFEVRLPDGSIVNKSDSDDAYGVVQNYAKRTRKAIKLVDVQKGITKEIDQHGNIDDDGDSGDDPVRLASEEELPDPNTVAKALKGYPELLKAVKEVIDISESGSRGYIAEDVARNVLQYIRDKGIRQASNDQSEDFDTLIETVKKGPDQNAMVRTLLNERLVSSIGEARKLVQEGYTVEDVRKARGGKNWAKGKWASKDISERLDSLADNLEAHGMREAAEKLGTLAYMLEASVSDHQKAIDNVKKAMHLLGWQGGTVHQVVEETGLSVEQIHEADDIESLVKDALKKKGKTTKEAVSLVDKPYIVEQLERAGFGVKRYPGEAERFSEDSKTPSGRGLQHLKSYTWVVTPPGDNVFDVKGVEQEELLLNTPGAGLKEETGDFTGVGVDDFKYIVMTSHPHGDIDPSTFVITTNKEQELISKLKKMLKPTVSLKMAATKYLDPSATEMREFLNKKFKGLVEEGDDTDFDIESAIYWFANDYHGGQGSDLYKALSTSKFNPGPSHRSVKDESEVASDMYEALEKEYAGS